MWGGWGSVEKFFGWRREGLFFNIVLLAVLSLSLYIYIYIYIKVNLVTVVKGNMRAPFSIAKTPKSSRGRYSFPWISPLYPCYVLYNAEFWAKGHQVPLFESLVWLDQGLNLGLSNHWRTLSHFKQSSCVLQKKELSPRLVANLWN